MRWEKRPSRISTEEALDTLTLKEAEPSIRKAQERTLFCDEGLVSSMWSGNP